MLGEIVRRPDADVDFDTVRWRGVADLVADAAALHPERTAVAADDAAWSYRELSDAADTVARRLIALGMPAQARLGIRLPRSPELVAVVVGALRAGAAVVPLDLDYPVARVRTMVAIAEPWAVVGDLDGHDRVFSPADLLAGAADPVVLPKPEPDDAAYVLFTSGSTGEPKGVAMPHRALANLITWQNARPTGAPGGVTLQFAPLSFDVSFQEVFSTLAGGGTLRLLAEGVRQDMRAVLDVIERGGVERVFLPYVALQAMVEVGRYPRSLRWVVSSGEQLRITPEIRALRAALPELVLENQYGPTETHVVLAHALPPGDAAPLPPVGTPITGATVTLLDDDMRPVPPGVRGEIHVEGVCVALGYENRPALTAQRFAPAPGGSLRYATGDIGVMLPDGEIVCLGRADGQVKVRGYRVECAEVELAVLAADHPGIEQVAVVPHDLGGSDAVLRAFLVGDPDRADTAALRARLGQVLPAHMVPSRYEWVDAIPRTPSGKRDDAALRARVPAAPARTGETTWRPRSPPSSPSSRACPTWTSTPGSSTRAARRSARPARP
ncbi:amino acid adenylation domain-containing protein [Actinokineospora soli]|uniref:Amino acid adenylation domain-containing protein n=1 Tax=Actinokineospora soli TaxID=1048753 RepID=A0ABW2TPL3_9PSEU